MWERYVQAKLLAQRLRETRADLGSASLNLVLSDDEGDDNDDNDDNDDDDEADACARAQQAGTQTPSRS